MDQPDDGPRPTWAGLRLDAGMLPGLVSSAAAGRPIVGDRWLEIDDPVAWLEGLWTATRGTPLEGPTRAGFDLVLRTGSSGQVAVLARLAARQPILDGAALVRALGGGRAQRSAEVARALAEAAVRPLIEAPELWDPELRPLVSDRGVRHALLPALLVVDREWILGQLGPLDRPETRALVDEALGRLPRRPRRAVLGALGGPSRPRGEDPPLVLDSAQLPWRGDDGAWFRVPEGAELPAGAYRIRRALRVRHVDRDALTGHELRPHEARRARARQLEALAALVRERVGAPARDPAPPSPDEVRRRLARARGLLAAVRDGPAARAVAAALIGEDDDDG